MPKLVTYNTLVRVGKAILTEAQKAESSIASITGEFKGYVSSQNELSSTLLKGDFYIADDVFVMTFGQQVLGISKDTILIANKNNPNKSQREDWIIIKSTVASEMVRLKEELESHINNTNNPHHVTLTQANGSTITDSTFQDLLSQL